MKVIFVLISMFVSSRGSDKILPRGVSLAQRLLYEPLKDFSCLDGSKKLPYMYVNDDYCDCADGSDEPGTSACPNGKFHCQNIGYIPLDLPTSRVNDGVCDCCDASDEYLFNNCTNTCHILGAEARKAAEKEAEIAAQGNELRLQMISSGKEIRQNKQDRLSALETEKLEAVRLKEEANRLKESAEAAEFAAKEAYNARQEEQRLLAENLEKERTENEAKDIFKQLDSNNDNILQVEELNLKVIFDGRNEGHLDNDEIQHYFGKVTEIDWDLFIKSWPKLSRDIIREKYSEDSSTDSPDTPPENLELHNNNYEQANINEDYSSNSDSLNFEKENLEFSRADIKKYENDNLNSEREEMNDDYYEHPAIRDHHFISNRNDDSDDENGMASDNENGLISDDENVENSDDEDEDDEDIEKDNERHDRTVINDNNYDEETLKFIEEANAARSRFESAERSLQDVERELTRIKESLSKDYGPEDEFIVLDGQCFSYTDREYTYKLCPFDQVVQMAKSGGSETRLGVWAGWQDEGSHKVMLYDKGQACWNGPNRSTKVVVVCGLDNGVIGAAEPNKCEYELILQTPAACKLPINSQTSHMHDEF